jgi:hypothetical protein
MVNAGVDLRKTHFTVCARGVKGSGKLGQYPAADAGYERFLRQAAEWQETGETVRAGVESAGNTRYFKSRLEAGGSR